MSDTAFNRLRRIGASGGPDPERYCRHEHGTVLADGNCSVCGKPWRSAQDARLAVIRPRTLEPPRNGSDYDRWWNPDAGGHAESWENM